MSARSRDLPVACAVMACLFAGVVAVQHLRERLAPAAADNRILYVRSTAFMQRLALSFDSLAADIYWIRALQHYGRTKLGEGPPDYVLLYPLLDLTTSLDPRFKIAYRFGAIFLAEPAPAGAGNPDQAMALLEKGLRAQPQRWEYAQDIGFVYYWWKRDYRQASEWFRRGAAIPGSPNWMAGLAAVTEARGGNRQASRKLWEEILSQSPEEWMVKQATFRLRQLTAMDQIDELTRRVQRYTSNMGRPPRTWADLGFGGSVPIDPDQFAFELDPASGTVSLNRQSTLNPLPVEGPNL